MTVFSAKIHPDDSSDYYYQLDMENEDVISLSVFIVKPSSSPIREEFITFSTKEARDIATAILKLHSLNRTRISSNI
jgi:hypothetical protein